MSQDKHWGYVCTLFFGLGPLMRFSLEGKTLRTGPSQRILFFTEEEKAKVIRFRRPFYIEGLPPKEQDAHRLDFAYQWAKDELEQTSATSVRFLPPTGASKSSLKLLQEFGRFLQRNWILMDTEKLIRYCDGKWDVEQIAYFLNHKRDELIGTQGLLLVTPGFDSQGDDEEDYADEFNL